MKTYLLTIGLLVFNLLAYSQNIYQIRADSVRIFNDCDTAELILENHTQTIPGYLFNKGFGRTEFRRMRLLNLGNGLISIPGQDTLDLSSSLGGYWIKLDSNLYNNNTGNVGIGKINPTEKLDVNGRIKTDMLRFPATNVMSTLITVGNDSLLKIGYGNIKMGLNVLPFGGTGSNNVVIGNNSLLNNSSSSFNVVVGNNSMTNNTTGANNSAFGGQALASNTTGGNNSAFGFQALSNNTSGGFNNAFGWSALNSNTTGSNNNAVGFYTLNRTTTGRENSAFGDQAMYSNITGSYNVAIGTHALYSNDKNSNVALGYYALYTTKGDVNVAVGYSAGRYHRGSSSIFIGNAADARDSVVNVTIIGNGLSTKVSNIVGLASANQSLIVGTNTSVSYGEEFNLNSGEKLQVNGNVKIAGGIRMPIRTIITDGILTSKDYTVLVRNTADVAVYLPQPSLNPGMIVNLKKVSNNTFEILIQVVDGTNIDDDSAYSFNTYGKNIQLQSDGTGWYVLSGQ